MEITAAMVKALRDETGLSMMACKTALVEAGGDAAKAKDLLRKKGLHAASKRASNETTQGRIVAWNDPAGGAAGMVDLRCESAPVANTDDFIQLATHIARRAAGMENPTPETILQQKLPDNPAQTLGDFAHEVFNRLRENIRIARVGRCQGVVGSYIHHNGQVGVLVEFNSDCPPALRADVCMHVAAMRPMCARREEVDPALVEKEKQFAAEQMKGKPANMIDKIVAGKLNKWYGEIVLLEQPFVKDDKKTVGQVLLEAAPKLTVTRFLRYEVGGT